jgi:hypothetical protein
MIRWKSWAVAVAAGLLALYALGLLYEGFASGRYSGALTYPFIDKTAAERAYDRLPPGAPPPERAAAAERLIQADPANPESWTAVAFADRETHGRLTAKGLEALDHSYAVSFFDRPGAVWRVSFALENWADLTPQIRQDVLKEANITLNDPHLVTPMKAHLATIHSPEGRLAAQLLLAMNTPTQPGGAKPGGAKPAGAP